MEKHRPKVGLGVFVRKGDEFLIGLRCGEHVPDVWCFPGGHLEFGESWEDASQRETDEEVGIVIDNIRHVATTNDIYPEENKHYITLFMMSDYVSGEVTLNEPNKFKEWKWCHWDELPDNLFPATKKLIADGFDPYTC